MITFGSDPIFVLAQVNIGGNPAVILGIALILCGVALYGMRSVRPELSRDHDIFFAAIALISGLILMFQGWRLDPLLLLGQLSLAGSAVFFAVENIRLRSVTTEQAKRNTPIVDDDRPVSRSYSYEYQAELDELPSTEERASARRIRGSRDPRSSDGDDYGEEVRRRPPSRRRKDDDDYGMNASDRLRKRRLSRSRSRPIEPPDRRSAWDEDTDDRDAAENYPSRSTSSRPSSPRSNNTSSRPPRRRPPRPTSARRSRATSSNAPDDYVDYQPVDYSDDESDDSLDYGERYR
ncbi:MAG: Ycf66 family protein [Elainellaceae cyanobacterium]